MYNVVLFENLYITSLKWILKPHKTTKKHCCPKNEVQLNTEIQEITVQ